MEGKCHTKQETFTRRNDERDCAFRAVKFVKTEGQEQDEKACNAPWGLAAVVSWACYERDVLVKDLVAM